MNCRQFQQDLDEYSEGSLSARAKAAAEKHLEGCAECRRRAQEYEEVARMLGEGMRQATQGLELPPAVGCRVLATLAEETASTEDLGRAGSFWRWLAWPALGAAATAVLAGGLLLVQRPAPRPAQPESRVARPQIVVQLSFVEPAYTFQRQEGHVIDALTTQTKVINETLPAVAGVR